MRGFQTILLQNVESWAQLLVCYQCSQITYDPAFLNQQTVAYTIFTGRVFGQHVQLGMLGAIFAKFPVVTLSKQNVTYRVPFEWWIQNALQCVLIARTFSTHFQHGHYQVMTKFKCCFFCTSAVIAKLQVIYERVGPSYSDYNLIGKMYSLVDDFPNSFDLCAWKCITLVRINYRLATYS